MRVKLDELREEARYYCARCPFAGEHDAGMVRCEHDAARDGGAVKKIVFSIGACPKGSWDHAAIAQQVEADHVRRAEAAAAELSPKETAVSAPPLAPIPRIAWPKDLEPFIERRVENDKGIGDTLGRLADGGNVDAEILLKAITSPCECWKRRRKANRLFSFAK